MNHKAKHDELKSLKKLERIFDFNGIYEKKKEGSIVELSINRYPTLYSSHQDIEGIDFEHLICKFPKLKTLKLSEVMINNWSEIAINCPQLETLVFEEYSNPKIPKEIWNLNIKHFQIRYLKNQKCIMLELPKNKLDLESLKLSFSSKNSERHKIKNIDEFFTFIPNVKFLTLDHVGKIPNRINQFHHLEDLKIVVGEIDSWFSEKIPLKRLSLGTVKLGFPLKFDIFLHLESLYLGNIKDFTLDSSLGNCTNLHEIKINKCGIANIPESITKLRKLEKLDVSYNNIAKIPESITKLRKLEKIDVSHNDISALPREIGDMIALKKINVESNENLNNLPESIQNLSKLEIFDDYKTALQKNHPYLKNIASRKKISIKSLKNISVTKIFEDFLYYKDIGNYNNKAILLEFLNRNYKKLEPEMTLKHIWILEENRFSFDNSSRNLIWDFQFLKQFIPKSTYKEISDYFGKQDKVYRYFDGWNGHEDYYFLVKQYLSKIMSSTPSKDVLAHHLEWLYRLQRDNNFYSSPNTFIQMIKDLRVITDNESEIFNLFLDEVKRFK